MVKVYVLYGEEQFLVDEKLQELLAASNGQAVTKMDMRETSISDLIVEADQTDLFSSDQSSKIMVLKDCYFLGSEKALSEADLKALTDYLKTGSSSTTLIFKCGKVDKRKKLTKQLLKEGESFEGKSIKYPQKWIITRGKFYGLKLDQSAADKMFLELGSNLYLLDSELKKLSLIYPNGAIKADMLTDVISRTLESDVFELINRIVKRQKTALDMLHDILLTGSNSIQILLLIARQFRIMQTIKLARESNIDVKTVLEIHPYSLQIANEQAQEYTAHELKEKIQQLSELDLKMKRGQCNKDIALEAMILKWL